MYIQNKSIVTKSEWRERTTIQLKCNSRRGRKTLNWDEEKSDYRRLLDRIEYSMEFNVPSFRFRVKCTSKMLYIYDNVVSCCNPIHGRRGPRRFGPSVRKKSPAILVWRGEKNWGSFQWIMEVSSVASSGSTWGELIPSGISSCSVSGCKYRNEFTENWNTSVKKVVELIHIPLLLNIFLD